MQLPPRPKGESRENELKFKDGENLIGVFRGEIRTLKQHYSQTKKRGWDCPSPAHCPDCEQGEFPKFRFELNFVFMDAETKQLASKIFAGGARVYDMLNDIQNTGYPLEETMVKISRSGRGQNTKWSITPIPNGKITDPDRLARITAVKLQDLGATPQSTANPQQGVPAWNPPEDPFGPPDAQKVGPDGIPW